MNGTYIIRQDNSFGELYNTTYTQTSHEKRERGRGGKKSLNDKVT